MRLATLGAVLAPLPLIQAGDLFPRARRGNGYLSVPVGMVARRHEDVGSLGKREDGESIRAVLENMGYFYATELEIGEPPQSVTVLVDTGSSELWVNPDCSSALYAKQAELCRDFGHYDPADSDTPPVKLEEGEITYGDLADPTTRTTIEVQYYADTITIGDVVITNQTFGVATASSGQPQGILGLAPDLDDGFGVEPYSMVLNTMYEQGVISVRSFALDLRHGEAATGAIVFGGLDRSKFIGSLEKLPVIKGLQGEYRLGVELNSLGVTMGGQSSSTPSTYELNGTDRNVILDSGTTIVRMHWQAAAPILEALDAVNDGEGYFYVSCDMREAAGSVDFGFGNKTLRVPLRDFIIDVGDSTWCAVGMGITTDQQIIGQSVLRSGYFVFDWDNKAVHVAQAADCGGDEDIVLIETGVPSVTGRCDEDDASFTGGVYEPSGTRPDSWPLPTGPYTTTYTISSCPPFERSCSTGAVTTETYGVVTTETARTNEEGDDGDAGDENEEDDGNGGLKLSSTAWGMAFVLITAAHNVL